MMKIFTILFVVFVVIGQVGNAEPMSAQFPSTEVGPEVRSLPDSRLDNCTTPFPEGFEGIIAPDVPECWLVIDANGDDFHWITSYGGGHSQPGSVYYPYNVQGAADDWLFSPGVELTGDTLYRLTFWQKVASADYPERLEVKYGVSQNVGGMNLTIVSMQQWANTGYEERIYEFVPPATATYYVGFHCISQPRMHNLTLDDISVARASGISSVGDARPEVPMYALQQNFPNPFNPSTRIAFDLSVDGIVSLKVYNLQAQEVATLLNSRMDAGTHTVAFDGTSLPSGVYIYRLQTPGLTATRKMLLMK